MENLQYPIGKFNFIGNITAEQRENWINEIEHAPLRLRLAIKGLSEQQLDTPYRDGGWTVRQVVHHLADSHMNSYIRFKLALTEDLPTIKAYVEADWAELSDSTLPIEVSLTLLEALHVRWVTLLRSINSDKFNRAFIHPSSGETRLDRNLGIYAWHGNHHIAHITSLRDRLGWTEDTAKSKQVLLEEFKAWLVYADQLRDLDEVDWETPIAEGKWSVRDVVSHIMLWDQYFCEGAIDKISAAVPLTLTFKGVTFNEFNKNAVQYAKEQTKSNLIAQAVAWRFRIVNQLELIPEADYHNEFKDGDGNPFSIYEYLLDFIGHDRHHMNQITLTKRVIL